MSVGWTIATFAVVVFAYDMAWKAIRWVVFVIAARFFGWRPKIYIESLAKSIAEEGINDICRAQEEVGEPISDFQRAILEEFGPWMIERYTFDFALGRK
jgi:hypothetical protein